MRRSLLLAFLVLLPGAAPAAQKLHLILPQFARPGARVDMIVPTPRPRIEPTEPAIDLSHALPGKTLATLPSSAQQLQHLSSELKQGAPRLSSAKARSATLAAEAASLRRQLIDTAARIESLEQSQVADAAEITRLEADDTRLSSGFVNDQVAVTRLLAILERLQHDMPPALAMRPDDALGAARGAMLIGATLPPVYAQAAALSRRIDALKRTRAALVRRRAEAKDTALRLTQARADLDLLLARKEREADTAAQDYGNLKLKLAEIARQAADFQALLSRVTALRRRAGPEDNVVTVTAQNAGSADILAKGSLVDPVVGTVTGGDETSSPGLTYATRANAQVITPADGKVLFAGPYHKSGQVLILEITTGYDLVLAGLGRVTVRPNDELLAGEPVGTMPAGTANSDNRLYFELRRAGHSVNPAPWLKPRLRPVL